MVTKKTIAITAVVDVMVEDITYDGILIQILEFVHVDEMSTSGQRITDDGFETTIPSKIQDDIINLTLVSKRFHRIISNHDENGRKKWNIIPVLQISSPQQHQQQPDSRVRVSSTTRLFNKLQDYSSNEDIYSNLQHYRLLIVKDIHKINYDVRFDWVNFDVVETIRDIRLNGITSLHISPTRQTNSKSNAGRFLSDFLVMLPNLYEINFSNINERDMYDAFFNNHVSPFLQIIKWNNIHFTVNFPLCGCFIADNRDYDNNVRQIMMDNSIFHCNEWQDGQVFADFEEREEEEEAEVPANNNNNDNDEEEEEEIFIFHQMIGEKIERLSIRGARYTEQSVHVYDQNKKENKNVPIITRPISQNALMKFVRNAPQTLQWFRSDLSLENITILQLERPTIEFL